MDDKPFPTLDQDRWTISTKDIEARVGGVLDSSDFHSPLDSPLVGNAADASPPISRPISSVMELNLWTVYAEDPVEKIEEVLSSQGVSSVPVMGSNGAIVGIVGPQELVPFHSEKKNAKAVRAWEISRCTMFEVNPNDSIEDVAKLMTENGIEYIAVTELGALHGVVSMLNLVQVILKENADNASMQDAGSVAKEERGADRADLTFESNLPGSGNPSDAGQFI